MTGKKPTGSPCVNDSWKGRWERRLAASFTRASASTRSSTRRQRVCTNLQAVFRTSSTPFIRVLPSVSTPTYLFFVISIRQEKVFSASREMGATNRLRVVWAARASAKRRVSLSENPRHSINSESVSP